ncbi:hypothetical protein DYGSA30_39610 [Dyella sp. GSA-30]|jgi:hypothetical protein|nr:hypothetical protein DYGSA30_39610 [Dyella sp. GSA-30]
MRRIRNRIIGVTTYEGRAMVVAQMTDDGKGRSLFSLDLSLDYRLRHFDGAPNRSQVVEARTLGIARMRVARHLGVRTGAELAKLTDALLKLPASFLVSWQQHGLLVSKEDLDLPNLPSIYMYLAGADERRFGIAFWRCLEQLKKAGAGIEALRTVHQTYDRYEITPKLLLAVVSLLRQKEISLDEAIVACGSSVWLVSPTRWHFVLNTVGAKNADDCAAFNDLLNSSGDLSTSLVEYLRQRGATLADLIAWQRWISAYDYRHTVPTSTHLDLLLASGLSLSDLPSGPGYLAAGTADSFAPFADAARSIGASTSADMLALHSAFVARDRRKVLELLPLHAAFGRPPLGEWSDFVAEIALKGGRSASVRYLQKAYGIKDLSKRGQLMQLCRLDDGFLAYLHDKRKLRSWRQLTRWHYDHGWGSEAIRLRGGPSASLEEAILNEAWRRDTFYTVAGTLDMLFMELADAARTTKHTKEDLIEILLARLPKLYAAGEGVLVPSLIRAGLASNLDLRAARRGIARAHAGLLGGLGPVGRELEPSQMEAVAYVYVVAHEDVRTLWPKVAGLQRQVRAFAPLGARHHVMRWTRRHLVSVAALPDSQLDALAQVGRWAEAWTLGNEVHALSVLNQQRLTDPAASLESLAGHWALLLALLAEDQNVRPWFAQLGEIFRDPVTAPADMAALNDWIHERLPVAVQACDQQATSPAFIVEALPRAVGQTATTPGVAAKILLDCLSPVLTRWLSEVRRSAFRDAEGQTELIASVSKAPAAFFARKATALCTSDDVDMWEESRHAHLVIFDPNTRTLAGMAMLYVQKIPEVDARRTTLVMRAINLPLLLREAYVRESVIDECIRVAAVIAATGGHAGPAFPPDTGQHLVSNDSELAKLMMRRYETDAFKRVPLNTSFYCYRQRSGLGAVDELFVLEPTLAVESTES